MKIQRSFPQYFIDSISGIFEALFKEPRYKMGLHPSIVIIILILFSTVSSFSYAYEMFALCFLGFIVLSLYFRVDLSRLLKIVLLAVAFSLVIYLPMVIYQWIFYNEPYGQLIQKMIFDKGGLAPLLIRTGLAAGFMAMIPLTLGTRGLIIGLRSLGIGEDFIWMVILTIRTIPLMLKEISRLFFGRESRVLVEESRIQFLWRILSTIAGEVLVRSIYRGEKLYQTLQSRIWMRVSYDSPKVNSIDILFASLSSIFILFIITLSVV